MPWYDIFKDQATQDAGYAAGGAVGKTLWDKWKNRSRKVTQGTVNRKTGSVKRDRKK